MQTQATIRGIIDRTAVDPISLQACEWSDLECFVELGRRHGSRVILVGDLAKLGHRYELRVARINVEFGQVIAAYQLTVDPAFVAIDTANDAIAGLTAAVVAKPTELTTPVDRGPTTACERPVSMQRRVLRVGHELVGHGLEADFIRKRTSTYSGRSGLVASPRVTLIDDPGVPGGRGTIAVDDEGVVPGPHLLIERGVLRGSLHDRLSAAAVGLPPGGSGRRQSFRDAPLPRMTNTWMAAGDEDPADILRSVKLGVYAARFSGGQVNIAGGDFVFALTEGYLIEDGRLTAPLRGVNLIGNGPAALAAVSMVGHDLQMSEGTWTCTKEGQNVPVGVGMPTVKIDALTIGGTTLAGGRG